MAETTTTPSLSLDITTLTTWQGFLSALKRLISSMKFWTFVLTLLIALGTKYGFNVDPSAYWTIVGLGAALLGVQGASDWGKNTAIVQAHASLTQQRLSIASNTLSPIASPEVKLLTTNDSGEVTVHMTDGSEHEIGDMLKGAGFAKSMIVRPGQAGFVKLGVMFAICAVAIGVLFAGCSSVDKDVKQVGSDVASCAQAESAAVKAHTSVVQVALDVVDIITKLIASPATEVATLIENATKTYGEPLVACAFNKYVAQHSSANGSASTSQPDPKVLAAKATIDAHGWAKFK